MRRVRPRPLADAARHHGGDLGAAYFHACNRGKRSIEADFEDAAEIARIKALAPAIQNAGAALLIEGYPELVAVSNTTMNQTGQAIEAIALLMAVYLAISLAISAFMNWYNNRVRLIER